MLRFIIALIMFSALIITFQQIHEVFVKDKLSFRDFMVRVITLYFYSYVKLVRYIYNGIIRGINMIRDKYTSKVKVIKKK